jgi:hypothetical protein
VRFTRTCSMVGINFSCDAAVKFSLKTFNYIKARLIFSVTRLEIDIRHAK